MKSLARHRFAFRTASRWSGAFLISVADLAKGYPIELRAMGTLQTLGWSIGKHDAAHSALANAIARWVLSDESGAPLSVVPENERSATRLVELLVERPRAAYLAADSEAIAVADALKVMAQALVNASGRVAAGGSAEAVPPEKGKS